MDYMVRKIVVIIMKLQKQLMVSPIFITNILGLLLVNTFLHSQYFLNGLIVYDNVFKSLMININVQIPAEEEGIIHLNVL